MFNINYKGLGSLNPNLISLSARHKQRDAPPTFTLLSTVTLHEKLLICLFIKLVYTHWSFPLFIRIMYIQTTFKINKNT